MLRFNYSHIDIGMNNLSPTTALHDVTSYQFVLPIFATHETRTLHTMRVGSEDITTLLVERKTLVDASETGTVRSMSYKQPAQHPLPLIFVPRALEALPRKSAVAEGVKTGVVNAVGLGLVGALIGALSCNLSMVILGLKGGAAAGALTGVGQGIWAHLDNDFVSFCAQANEFLLLAQQQGTSYEALQKFSQLYDNVNSDRKQDLMQAILAALEVQFGIPACAPFGEEMFRHLY